MESANYGLLSDWDDLHATVSGMQTSFDTIPLQLNIPERDRFTLNTNDHEIISNDEFNEMMTPHMTDFDPDVITPDVSGACKTYDSSSSSSKKKKKKKKKKKEKRKKMKIANAMLNIEDKILNSNANNNDIELMPRLKELEKPLSKKFETETYPIDVILSVEDQPRISFKIENHNLDIGEAFIPEVDEGESPIKQQSQTVYSKMYSSGLHSRTKSVTLHKSPQKIFSERRSSSPSHRQRSSSHRSRERSPRKLCPTYLAHFHDEHKNRKWELSHAEHTESSNKRVQYCENGLEYFCQILSTNVKPSVKLKNPNIEFNEYDNCLVNPFLQQQPAIEHSFGHSNQFSDQASGMFVNQWEFSKIPIFNSLEELPTQRAPFIRKGNLLEIVPIPHEILSSLNAIPTKLTESNYVAKNEMEPIESKNAEINLTIKLERENITSKLDESNEDQKIKKEPTESKNAETELKRKQKRGKKHLATSIRKEKLRLEIEELKALCASSSKMKRMLFDDGIASDRASTKTKDTTRSLDRGTDQKLGKRCDAGKKATMIKKELVPEILPLIDPRLPPPPPPAGDPPSPPAGDPPSPPAGDPPSQLPQPTLKNFPKLVYFHYNPETNTVQPSTHLIPQTSDNVASMLASTLNMYYGLSNGHQQPLPNATNLISSRPATTKFPKKSLVKRQLKSSVVHFGRTSFKTSTVKLNEKC